MSAVVGLRPGLPQISAALVGRTVSSVTWLDIARAVNWVLGRGAQPVPIGSPLNVGALGAGATYTWAWRVAPRYQAHCRLWQIVARSDSGTAGSSINVAAPSGASTRNYGLPRYTRTASTIYYLEELASQSSAEQTLTLTIAPVTNAVVVESIGCVDVPRLELLTTGSDLGMDLVRANPWQPVWAADGAADEGWHRLADALSAMSNIGRRVSHMAWAAPYLTGATPLTTYVRSATDVTGPQNLSVVPYPIASRKGSVDAGGSTTTAVALEHRALMWVSGGAVTGRINITPAGGSVVSATTSSTTPVWLSLNDTVHRQEDPTQSKGLNGDTFANHDCTITLDLATTAPGTVYCAGVCIYEG